MHGMDPSSIKEMNMKIVVYAIAKNEASFVKRFMENIKSEADAVYVLDTGSTDNTVELLRAEGAIVTSATFNPWRFDIPRNASLACIPDDVDVCVCIDLDEVLTPGWRKAIEQAWIVGETTRLRYEYVWNHEADGSPGTTFWYDKIHQRKNYRWVKPVHEILQIYNQEEVQTKCDGFTLHHWPDNTKSRGSYLPLLELAVSEDLEDDRSSHYLGREYMFYGYYQKAINELKRHLDLGKSIWKPERAASMRFISRCLLINNDDDSIKEALAWAQRACIEAPSDREPWVELARAAYKAADFITVYYACKKALEIVERPMSYICEPFAWNETPHDYLAIAAWELGHKSEAVKEAEIALSKNPNDDRLKNNISFMLSNLKSISKEL